MKIKTLVILLMLIVALSLNAVKFGNSFYADHKSYEIGDILTVMITEQASASASAGEKTDKSFEHGVSTSQGAGPLDFIPLSSMGLKSNHKAEGDASTTRQGKLEATMTVRIFAIDENGNLKIKGKRSVNINGEEQLTHIEGLVRPQDVRANNTLYSYNIADAKISYSGKGTLREGSRVGLISRIFNFLF